MNMISPFPSDQFWMVYGIGRDAPTVRHGSVDEATSEAKRLARANPGTTFVILEAVGAVVKNDLQTVSYRQRDYDSEIPF